MGNCGHLLEYWRVALGGGRCDRRGWQVYLLFLQRRSVSASSRLSLLLSVKAAGFGIFSSICDSGSEGAALEGSSGALNLAGVFGSSASFANIACWMGGKTDALGCAGCRRNPETGEILHDDLLVSAALSAILDRQSWFMASPGVILQPRDVLDDLDEGF